MKKAIEYFQSLRLLNVAAMLLLLVGLRYFFYRNFFDDHILYFQRTTIEFSVFLFVIALVTIGGYIINDYYDYEVDKINCPNKVYVIPHDKMLFVYLLLNLLSIVLSVQFGKIVLGIISGTILLLFLYSKYLQKLPLIGNFTIAFLSAVLPWLYLQFDDMQMQTTNGVNKEIINITIFTYAVFGFWITLLREIVKDLQDKVGDEQGGYKTLPITLGVKKTVIVLVVLTLFPAFIINYIVYFYFHTSIGVSVLDSFLLIYLIYLIKHKFKPAGTALKIILFLGVFLLYII